LLGRFVDKFLGALRKVFPAVQTGCHGPRDSLKSADTVIKLEDSQQLPERGLWFDLGYINLNTWAHAHLQLQASDDPRHIEQAAPHVALVTVRGRPCSFHRTLARLKLDLDVQWSLSVWHLEPARGRVQFEPHKVQVRQLLAESFEFWTGLPAPKRRLPRLAAELEDGVSDDEFYGASDAVDDGWPPPRPDEEEVDENESFLQGIAECLGDADLFSNSDDEPAAEVHGAPATPVRVRRGSDTPDANTPRGADTPVARPESPLPCDGVALVAATTQEDEEAGPVAAGRGWGRDGGGARIPYNTVPVYNGPDRPADQLGHIKVNLAARSLDAHCLTCGARCNRTYNNISGQGHRGRPMGTLLAWLAFRCTGRKDQHRAELGGLSHDLRTERRDWGLTVEALQPLFAFEREQFPHETVEPQREA
jgi:hypothetical protein